MHQQPPKTPLFASTSPANASQLDSSRALIVYPDPTSTQPNPPGRIALGWASVPEWPLSVARSPCGSRRSRGRLRASLEQVRARLEVAEASGDEASAISFHHFQGDQPLQDRRRHHRLAATLTVGLATPPASHAIDGTSTSAYFCSSPSTPWLTYGGMAGYKCFQYSNGTGASSPATRR